MSTYMTMVTRANALFDPNNINTLNPALVELGRAKIEDRLMPREIAKSSEEEQYFKNWPPSLKDALQAIVYSALSRSPRLQVTFAWEPGYYYELRACETPGTAKSPGGITIYLKSPFPQS